MVLMPRLNPLCSSLHELNGVKLNIVDWKKATKNAREAGRPPVSKFLPSFHLSQGVPINLKLSTNCRDRACFQIFLAPIRNGCSSPRSWVKPFSMRSATTTYYFTTSNCTQFLGELSVIHPSVITKDSNNTGASP